MKGWRRNCLYLAFLLGEATGVPVVAHSPTIEDKSGTGLAVEERVFRQFKQIAQTDWLTYLGAIRPPRVSADFKARVRATLPPEGEVQPKGRVAEKLHRLVPVLRYHDRSSDIDVRVIDVFQAAVGFHARCVVLISEPAIRLLTVPELQAIVAHEVSHEYVWEKYESARRQGDYPRIRELELWCDGIAILTLTDLGIDPGSLTTGLSKLTRFNTRFGTPLDANEYPSNSTRSVFHKRLIKILKGSNVPRRNPGSPSEFVSSSSIASDGRQKVPSE